MARILTLLSSGVTAAHKQGLFPCADPLSASSKTRAHSIALDLHRFDCAWSAPDPASLQTAAAVGLEVTPDPALAELDYGTWAGRSIQEIMEAKPDQFSGWMRGEFTPGDESLEDLFGRVGQWLSNHLAGHLSGKSRMVAVASPNVVRACVLVALDMTPAQVSKLDIPSLTLSTLTSNGREWRVRSVGSPPAFSKPITDENADWGLGVDHFPENLTTL
ncbi:histidine phosphatase family protein [Agrobacterium vitis]|uniref:histidine phosphatase family protein n=1 Tax=Agrobacterium vitis TaxID=373 RepID=UPI0015D8CD0F|nr:histidine phosphatase family protein [Agrobacterium vitis]